MMYINIIYMQILDKISNEYELKIDSLEDLWVLSEFIVPNNRVFSTTTRKVKIGSDSTKQATKVIFVDLLVKKVSFDSDILRVSGEIQNETDFTAKGQYQTLNFSVNDKIKIKKENILEFEKKLLNSACNSKSNKYLLVLLDKDELIVSEFNNYNYKVFFHEKGLGNKKYITTNINENEEKYILIKDFLNKGYSSIIFSGPGIYKNNLQNYIKSKLGITILLFPGFDVNSNSIPKIIKDISKSGILENSQLGEENKLIEELLKNISLNSKFVYGFDNTKDAINQGSIDKLLVTSKFIEQKKDDGSYLELNSLIKLVEQLNGSFYIINSKNESGRILDGIGSIGGILRY